MKLPYKYRKCQKHPDADHDRYFVCAYCHIELMAAARSIVHACENSADMTPFVKKLKN